jgi:tRNA uridine 5-carboxymethylaminomethyl modification enzyme
MSARRFDVLVVGAGHAGAEAASAAARLGCRVGLVTLSIETAGHMPCNPAVGGTAKGHLVREIDALGGLMGKAIDATGIQFKLLNRSRGPAVWSPRAQADKHAYARWVANYLVTTPNIDVVQARAGRIVIDRGKVSALELEDGGRLQCAAIVITTGTFLNGLVHVGRDQRPAGRHGEPPSRALAESIRDLGLTMGRLKTGTPPRLHRRSIDFDGGAARGEFVEERGDDVPVPLSFETRGPLRNKVSCWLLHTNEPVHALVRDHIADSPLFNGQIRGIGPRYCPSLEDKVMRFPDRERHQLFLEPEGLDVDEIYVNGLSMSLPAETQERIVRALPGLSRAELIRPGYAVEYDFVQPTELRRTLECERSPVCISPVRSTALPATRRPPHKACSRASTQHWPCATGRVRAAAGRGLHRRAGRRPRNQRLSRAVSHVHLTAEHRLLLRIDNADLRLTPNAHVLGLVDDRRWQRFERRRSRYAHNMARLDETVEVGLEKMPASQALRRPEVRLSDLVQSGLALDVSDDLDLLSLKRPSSTKAT